MCSALRDLPPDVTWVEDMVRYRRMATDARPGENVVPLLRPADEERARRWRAVLGWYQDRLDSIAQAARPSTAASPGLVVALESEFTEPAAFYAAATGRRFEQVRTLDELRRRPPVQDDSAETLTLVAPTSALHRRALLPLTRWNLPAWGILTAADVPGLTFLMAKLLYSRRLAAGSCAVIDKVADEWYEIEDDGRAAPPSPLDGGTILEQIRDGEWHALGISAHGEAGHLNVHPLVLCGLLGDVERMPSGQALDGCRVLQEGRHCKRAAGSDTTAMSFSAVRAVHLAVFSCSSSSVSYEPYPSSISAVLSAVDGYACSVLTTDRLVHIGEHDARLALAFLRTGSGTGAVADCMNDLQLRRAEARPFMVFGDPSGGPARAQGSPDRVPIAPSSSAVVRVRLTERPKLLDMSPRRPGLTLVAGRDTAFVLSRDRSEVVTVQLADATARGEQTALRFRQLGERVVRAAALERAIMRWMGGDPWRIPAENPLTSLRRQRLGLEHAIETGLAGVERCRSSGVWDPQLDAWFDQCAHHVGQWDRGFANALAGHLMANIAELLMDSHLTVGREPAGSCDSCDSPLTRTRATPALGRHPDRVWIECSSCGIEEVARVGEGRIRLRSVPRLVRGAEVTVTADVSAVNESVPAGLPAGFLVLEARDITRKTPFVQIMEQHTEDVCRPAFTVAPDLSPELHPLRICWVRALEVTLLRRRLPAFPAALDETGSSP